MKYLRTIAATLIILAGIVGWDYTFVQASTPAFTSFQLSTTTPSNGYVLQTDGSGNHWVATSTLGISGGSGTPGGASSTVQFNSNGAFAGNTGFVYTGSSVGIGTTSPASLLDVESMLSAASTEYKLLSVGQGINGFYLGYLTNGAGMISEARLRANDNLPLALGTTHYPESIYVQDQAAGSVPQIGIGTSSPMGILDIGGYGTPVSTTAGDGVFIGLNTPHSDGIEMRNLSTAATAGTRFAIVDSTNNTFVLDQPSTGNTGSALFGLSRPTTSFLYNNGGGSARDLAIGTLGATNLILGTNNAEVLRITSAGNVGIGSTTPWGQLSVNPNGITGPAFVIGSSTATNFIVTNGGNVGIGTTNPLSTLQIGPSSNTTTHYQFGVAAYDTTASLPQIIFNNSGSHFNAIGYDKVAGALVFGTTDALNQASFRNESLAITQAGNVGIGTTSPYAALSIGGGNLVLGAATAGGTPGDLFLPKLGTAAGAFLAVDGTGKVIATTTPSGGSGTVTSISGSGGTTGLTLTGGPITNSGTLTLGGTLIVANGGTGQTTFTGGQLLYGNSAGAIQSVATSTLTASSPLTGSFTQIGSGGSLGCQIASGSQAGCLSSADWTTFNGKGSGTVTGVSVASANGFAGTSSGGATPSLTLSTSITGLLKGNGTAISAASAGTDYLAPTGSGAGLTGIPTSVSNSDNTLTISPTTGAVVASLNLTHANTWTGLQQFNANASTTALTVTGSAWLATAGGSVGVGTTSPSKLFTVEGNQSGGIARIQRDISASSNSIYGTYDVVLNELQGGGLVDMTGPAQTFGVMNNGGTENLYGEIYATRAGADTTGNLTLQSYTSGSPSSFAALTVSGTTNGVVVGSTTPSGSSTYCNTWSFCVTGISNPGIKLVSTQSTPIQLAIEAQSSPSNVALLGTISNDPVSILTNNIQRLTVASGGSVGIGTSTPSAQLDIASSTGNQLALSDGSLTSPHWAFRNSNGVLYIGTTTPSGYATSSPPAIQISSSATTLFGIGTTSPWQTLSIVGGGAWNGLAAPASGNDTVCINPTSFQLFMGGSSSNCNVSDENAKYDINPDSAHGIAEVMELKPVTYYYKDKIDKSEFIGFLAQDVAKVDPDLVQFSASDTPAALKNEDFIGLYGKAIQDEQNEILAIKSGAIKDAQDNWQWLAIGLLLMGLIAQQIQIRNVKKRI